MVSPVKRTLPPLWRDIPSTYIPIGSSSQVRSAKPTPLRIITPPPFPNRFAKSKKEEGEKAILETFQNGHASTLIFHGYLMICLICTCY